MGFKTRDNLMEKKLTKSELMAQLAVIQEQLDESPEWEIGQEILTSRGLAKVIQYYTEDGLDKVQVEMSPLDTRDMITLLPDASSHLMSMPHDIFRTIIADHQMDQQARQKIAGQQATQQEFIEFLKYKKEKEAQSASIEPNAQEVE